MDLALSITRDPAEIEAAQRLRHEVFVREMGAASEAPAGREADAFDPHCDHLLLRDRARPGRGVVGTLRIGRGEGPGFYTEREFDLSDLHGSGRALAEMGRACLHPGYRGGAVLATMLGGLMDHLAEAGVGLLTGVASFPGTEPDRLAPALAALEARALAPRGLRPRAVGPQAYRSHAAPDAGAMRDVPALIKTYLRAGAWVGEGAWVDRTFNTVDVCLVLDLARARPTPLRG